ncbi:MAG: hypothetical protein K9J81_01790 [Desulfohalobiaceae bacterium]|nr:hypothetical protein [Desulfohalobiaceae bacterium]
MLLVNFASGEIDQELPRKAELFTWRSLRLERVRERAVQCALYSVYWVAGEASFGWIRKLIKTIFNEGLVIYESGEE